MGVTVDLKGRRVLLTGASSGIGAATCRAIVGCGGSVAMLARRKDRLDELEHELGRRPQFRSVLHGTAGCWIGRITVARAACAGDG